MSLVFSNTSSPYNGVIQRCEVMVYGPDGLGRISGNSVQLGLWTTRANTAAVKIHERILQVAGFKRQSDDPNHTDYNTIFLDTVANQRDYTIASNQDENGNMILDLYKVFYKPDGGTYEPLDLADELSDPDFYDGNTVTGNPTKYARKGENSFFVHPIPDASVTNGFKLEISREPNLFTTGDTTQKPGFRASLHDLLPTYMVLDYAEENVVSNVNLIRERAKNLENALDKAYSKVAPDVQGKITPKRILYM